jgi:hypothetical protein
MGKGGYETDGSTSSAILVTVEEASATHVAASGDEDHLD